MNCYSKEETYPSSIEQPPRYVTRWTQFEQVGEVAPTINIIIYEQNHPDHGVFISADPEPGDEDDPVTQNGYTYADNNPAMMTDPDGHIAQFLILVVFMAREWLLYMQDVMWLRRVQNILTDMLEEKLLRKKL